MSFWLNFFIVTFVVSALFAVLFSPWMFKILQASPISGVALETIVVRMLFQHMSAVQCVTLDRL